MVKRRFSKRDKPNDICDFCGHPYHRYKPNQKYCSHQCSLDGSPYYRNRQLVEKKCLACNNYFSTYKKNQTYCCDDCAKKAAKALYLIRREKNEKDLPCLRMRFQVFQRDGFHCKYCGRGISDGIKLHADHVIPAAKGGKTVMENLVTACYECNMGKGDILLEIYQRPTI